MRCITFTFLIPALWCGCTRSDVTIVPPKVPQGGRAVSIAVSQNNEKRLIVATESGGLFRTFDGGGSFHHLGGFPTFAPVDVSIASLSPDTVIATARDDFRGVSGGGIWRSADGGASWRRPAEWPPAPGIGCPTRPEACGISHMPLTRTFYVATDCGIAVSTDNGASFSVAVLDASLPPRFDSLQHRVRSVLVLNRTTGVADGRLWFSSDKGVNWDQMAAPPQGNREHFVRVGRGLDGDATHIDVYYGDGFALHRQTVTTAVPGGCPRPVFPRSMWQPLAALAFHRLLNPEIRCPCTDTAS
ncbi:MAG: WD40/YVTN/BNR-like repeat-containing protein [Gemmatimonadaceae bacterium]